MVYERPGNYVRKLAAATDKGMITWKRISEQSNEDLIQAKSLCMTSFAVTKDQATDHLISWPRIQNMLCADPLDVNLPDPSLIVRIDLEATIQLPRLAVDVENMFHNV